MLEIMASPMIGRPDRPGPRVFVSLGRAYVILTG